MACYGGSFLRCVAFFRVEDDLLQASAREELRRTHEVERAQWENNLER